MATCTFLEPGTDATQDFTFFKNGKNVFGAGTSLTSATDQAHTGARSMKVIVANTNDASGGVSGNGVVSDAGAAMMCWARFASVTPSVDTFFLIATTINVGNDIIGVGLDTTGHLVVNGVGQYANRQHGATVLSANTWYRVTMSYVITSSSNWSVSVYLNGVLEVTMSSAQGNLSAVSTSCAMFGIDAFTLTNNVSSILTMWIDDMYVDNRTDQSDPGNISVTAKQPFANGTTNGFTGTGTPSGYGSGNARYVNEQPTNSTNFVSVAASGSPITEEYNIEGLSVGDVDLTGKTIKIVMGWLIVNTTVPETGNIVVDGTQTNISITASSPPSASTLFQQVSATPTAFPAGAGTDIGVVTSTAAATVKLYECGILVAFSPTDFIPQEIPIFVQELSGAMIGQMYQ